MEQKKMHVRKKNPFLSGDAFYATFEARFGLLVERRSRENDVALLIVSQNPLFGFAKSSPRFEKRFLFCFVNWNTRPGSVLMADSDSSSKSGLEATIPFLQASIFFLQKLAKNTKIFFSLFGKNTFSPPKNAQNCSPIFFPEDSRCQLVISARIICRAHFSRFKREFWKKVHFLDHFWVKNRIFLCKKVWIFFKPLINCHSQKSTFSFCEAKKQVRLKRKHLYWKKLQKNSFWKISFLRRVTAIFVPTERSFMKGSKNFNWLVFSFSQKKLNKKQKELFQKFLRISASPLPGAGPWVTSPSKLSDQ